MRHFKVLSPIAKTDDSGFFQPGEVVSSRDLGADRVKVYETLSGVIEEVTAETKAEAKEVVEAETPPAPTEVAATVEPIAAGATPEAEESPKPKRKR